jgi:CheY-like chemotaxis protein
VFWVEVPYVPAVDEGLKRVNSGLRTLMHTGSSGDGMDQGTTAAPATVLGAVDLTKIGAAATGSRALPHDETTTVAAAPTAASTVSSDSSGSGSGDALNADVEGEGEDEGEEGRKNGQEWCKVCNLSDEDFVSSLVSVFEAAAAVAAKLSDEESLSNSGSSLPPEKAGSNPNGWDQHVVPELPPLPPPALREVPRVMGGGGANSSGGKGGGGFRSGGSGRLLVVDDSVMVKKLLCRALQQNNFSVDTAANGREGLIKMQNDGPYCAVLMDFLMPVLDGIAVSVSRRL